MTITSLERGGGQVSRGSKLIKRLQEQMTNLYKILISSISTFCKHGYLTLQL